MDRKTFDKFIYKLLAAYPNNDSLPHGKRDVDVWYSYLRDIDEAIMHGIIDHHILYKNNPPTIASIHDDYTSVTKETLYKPPFE